MPRRRPSARTPTAEHESCISDYHTHTASSGPSLILDAHMRAEAVHDSCLVPKRHLPSKQARPLGHRAKVGVVSVDSC